MKTMKTKTMKTMMILMISTFLVHSAFATEDDTATENDTKSAGLLYTVGGKILDVVTVSVTSSVLSGVLGYTCSRLINPNPYSTNHIFAAVDTALMGLGAGLIGGVYKACTGSSFSKTTGASLIPVSAWVVYCLLRKR